LPAAPKSEHFDIHASVVFQLGESLISDSVQALMELVKNSYDADASYCKVTISTGTEGSEESAFRGAVGSITVEDDGVGMTLDDIRRGWLTISNSGKRDFKKKKLTTAKGRTPLGDKGLGRLGTQRLGYNLEMYTRSADSAIEHHVWFSWKDFLDQQRLSEVDVHYEERTPEIKRGTRLIVSELRELPLWKGTAAVRNLETNLSQMISPYREVRDFTVIATVDGKKLELLEIGERLRQAAQLRYILDFDGELFKITGKAKLSYLRPEKSADRELFATLVERDGGAAFYQFLLTTKNVPPYSFKLVMDGGWFVEYSLGRELGDYPELDLVAGSPANPGPFHGEIDYFDLGADTAAEQVGVFSKASEYRTLVSKLSGIKVFRDGFGVRVGSDWLNLGQQWTKAGSYYTLKPHNTLGYIAISARDNPQLEEMTDREGFKTGPHYNNLYELLQSFIEFSANAQGFLRRGWVDYRNAHQKELANVASETTPEDLSRTIQRGLTRAASYRLSLDQVAKRLQRSSTASVTAINGIASKGTWDSGAITGLSSMLTTLKADVDQAERLIVDVESYLKELERLEAAGTVLTQQIEALRDRIQQVHEIIGLGLTAEALSHEINNVITQLSQRNQQISRYMKTSKITDLRLLSFTEYVKATTDALRRQMLFLAPSLQYVRENREDINVEQFVTDIFKHYTTYFADQPIRVVPKALKGQRFVISINRGKLIQIMDNLILNSEYWLKEDIRAGRLAAGTIAIEAIKPFITISDNGRGVDPSIEDAIFQPFVSAKGKGKGRGLGLYIVEQMLQAEDCNIRLLPERNSYGRMYKFELDLTGALIDKR
jgi:signal transduction histidine kinase